MDLLGDIGTNDQLIATRTENQLLKAKVERLSKQVDDLTLQVAVLQAEVELYREEARHSVTSVDDGTSSNRVPDDDGIVKDSSSAESPFVFQLPSTGSNSYCSKPHQVFPELHGSANPTCIACAIDSCDKTILVTGGADATICFTPMDTGTGMVDDSVTKAKSSTSVQLSAPVVCMGAMEFGAPFDILVAAGSMDGHVHCAVYSNHSADLARVCDSSSMIATDDSSGVLKKHGKYVSAMSWSRRCYFPSAGLASKPGCFLSTASAEGTVHLYFVSATDEELQIQPIESLYFDDAITCLCFTNDTGSGMENDIVLYAYVRNTPHLKVIRMPTTDDGQAPCVITTLHLNASLFDNHVSFAVLDLKLSADARYVAAACDNHCHLIIDHRSSTNPLATIVRRLYGHTADAYSRPVVAWSQDGQYVYCNTQHASNLCVYSIASGALLEDKDAPHSGHTRPIKDLHSHPSKKLVVTTSFDRNTILWVPHD